jgi:hypothetical protein
MIQNYKVTRILDTYVLIPNTHTIHVHRMIKINAVGVFLFELLSKELTYQEILETFIKTYGLSLDQGRRDVDYFIKRLKDNNILESYSKDVLYAKL